MQGPWLGQTELLPWTLSLPLFLSVYHRLSSLFPLLTPLSN